MDNQIKLLTSLAKQIVAEKKSKKTVVKTLQSAKILTKGENFTGNFSNLKRIASVK